VAVSWALLFSSPDFARQFELASRGLTPRQAQLEETAHVIREAASDTKSVIMLSADSDDVAFARYVLYPILVEEAAVGRRQVVLERLESLSPGELVLISAHGDRERLGDLEPLQRGSSPRLARIARAGDVSLFRVLR
jgi:hypothetical protein